MVPLPGSDVHDRSPPWARTMRLTSARPSPRPPKRLVVEPSAWAKSSKIVSRRSGSMPTPWSSTASTSWGPVPFSCTEALTRIADRPDPVPDEVFEAAARHYDEQELAALIIEIGAINVWNRFNVATRMPAGSWV